MRSEAWKRAKKLCKLTQEDLRTARLVGLRPETLIANRSKTDTRAKNAVKDLIRWVYGREYGPCTRQEFEERVYWEDYADRNAPDP